MPRPRKPLAQHRVEGTLRAHHARRREVASTGDLATQPPPAHLSECERVIWHQACRVAPVGLLTAADTFLLDAFCCAVAAHREARAALATSPLLVEAGNGSRVVNPLAGEARRQARLVAELGARLGLEPQARLRLLDGVPPETEVMDAEFRQMFGPLRVIRGDRG
jgi:P27 family predicted phage terminase small subunit